MAKKNDEINTEALVEPGSQQPHAAQAENSHTDYQHEEAPKGGFKEFWAQRWVRVTAISVAAAIALVGAFGVGVVAGERISGGDRGSFSQNGFGGQGGPQFGGGQGGQQFGGPQGGCPADDPDHCAGTDRNQHGFTVPNSTGTTSGSSTTSGTKSQKQ